MHAGPLQARLNTCPPGLLPACSPACSWSAATNKWTSHTVEAPKNLGGTIKRISISSITTVPRVKQAFAAGDIETTANKAVPCVWHWSGGTAWKATKASRWQRGVGLRSA